MRCPSDQCGRLRRPRVTGRRRTFTNIKPVVTPGSGRSRPRANIRMPRAHMGLWRRGEREIDGRRSPRAIRYMWGRRGCQRVVHARHRAGGHRRGDSSILSHVAVIVLGCPLRQRWGDKAGSLCSWLWLSRMIHRSRTSHACVGSSSTALSALWTPSPCPPPRASTLRDQV